MRLAWLLFAPLLGLISDAVADEPAKKYQVVTPKDDGIIATGINNRGAIVGFEWVEQQGTTRRDRAGAVLCPGEGDDLPAAARRLHGHLPCGGQRQRPRGRPCGKPGAARSGCCAAEPGVRLGGWAGHPRPRRAA